MSGGSLRDVLYGSLTLTLRGADVPSCIGYLQRAGITLRDVRVRNRQARCTICLRDFDSFYQTCRTNHVRFRVEARHGLPFWGHRLWHRKAFALGAIAFVCVVYTMSSIIWKIDVTGPENEDGTLQLREAAQSAGLYIGQTKSHLPNPVVLAQRILSASPDFVWVGVQTTGSVVTIQAIPKVAGAKPLDEVPHNIVATQPAVIRNVSASRGRVVVKKNQFVHPGQLLISGTLADGGAMVPADGQVMAEVWYTSKIEVPLKVKQVGLTGVSVKRDYLVIGQLKLRLWGFQEPHFSASYERDRGTDWHLGSYVLPIQWQNVQQYEVSASVADQGKAAAEQTARRLAVSDVKTQMGGRGKLLGQSVLHQQVAHGTLYETVLTRVEQNIGVPAAIPKPMTPPPTGTDTGTPHA